MAKQKKSPWLAAILNFLLFGLGYIYVGKRVAFGIGLIIATIIYTGLTWNYEYTWVDLMFGVAIGLLFAYDGYKTAEEVNKKR
ncbi:hypothetical protein HY448_00650 [Candidatus Pacearchaeota archaeon]|nr:hypothetical protein [Candidatus Pacearchaeota archaeon]